MYGMSTVSVPVRYLVHVLYHFRSTHASRAQISQSKHALCVLFIMICHTWPTCFDFAALHQTVLVKILYHGNRLLKLLYHFDSFWSVWRVECYDDVLVVLGFRCSSGSKINIESQRVSLLHHLRGWAYLLISRTNLRKRDIKALQNQKVFLFSLLDFNVSMNTKRKKELNNWNTWSLNSYLRLSPLLCCY
jgi:hypothetical protein